MQFIKLRKLKRIRRKSLISLVKSPQIMIAQTLSQKLNLKSFIIRNSEKLSWQKSKHKLKWKSGFLNKITLLKQSNKIGQNTCFENTNKEPKIGKMFNFLHSILLILTNQIDNNSRDTTNGKKLKKIFLTKCYLKMKIKHQSLFKRGLFN